MSKKEYIEKQMRVYNDKELTCNKTASLQLVNKIILVSK